MPTDPRTSDGSCENSAPFNPPLSAWQTGGAGAGSVPQTFLDALTWPPATLTNEAVLSTLPQYTQTGTPITLPGPVFTSGSATLSAATGDGWANPSDTAQLFVPVASCGYLDPWMGPTASPAACPPLARRRDAFVPRGAAVPTPAPTW